MIIQELSIVGKIQYVMTVSLWNCKLLFSTLIIPHQCFLFSSAYRNKQGIFLDRQNFLNHALISLKAAQMPQTCQNPTQCNSTQLNSTSVGVRHSSHMFHHHHHHPTLPQTFHPLLDQLESWNLAQTLSRPIWLI